MISSELEIRRCILHLLESAPAPLPFPCASNSGSRILCSESRAQDPESRIPGAWILASRHYLAVFNEHNKLIFLKQVPGECIRVYKKHGLESWKSPPGRQQLGVQIRSRVDFATTSTSPSYFIGSILSREYERSARGLNNLSDSIRNRTSKTYLI